MDITTQKKVFDVDSKDDVVLIKKGTNEPVSTTAEALARVGNDATLFLQIVNDGLKAYAIEQLANDPKVPWQVENEDGTFTDFTGTTLSETQSKFLAGMVLNMAKMNGYTKDLAKDKKRALKDAAQDGILAMPGFIENLKASSAV